MEEIKSFIFKPHGMPYIDLSPHDVIVPIGNPENVIEVVVGNIIYTTTAQEIANFLIEQSNKRIAEWNKLTKEAT